MNTNEFLNKTVVERETSSGYSFQEIRPQVICADGTFLSIQASDGHYCSPRINGNVNYSEVEVGYPSIRPPKTWKKYFDGEWQKLGIFGWIQRVWKDRSQVIYLLKNKPVSKWMLQHYVGFQDNACNSVYAYIPTILVDEFIKEHGGINEEETFKDKS